VRENDDWVYAEFAETPSLNRIDVDQPAPAEGAPADDPDAPPGAPGTQPPAPQPQGSGQF
jgi:penicillin-binding protein 1A